MFTLSNELYYAHSTVAAYNRGRSHATTYLAANSANLMDSVFFLAEGDRSTFLQTMMQVFGCTYICLWSYESNLPQPFNCLRYKDGFYRERNNQPSSSSGSLAQMKFNEYQQSLFIVDHGSHVPGYALVNNIPYIELSSDNLQKLASTEAQRQFYQAAGIKTAVFMGCNAGEIELGFSEDSQVNIEMEMRNWFPGDFSRQLPTRELAQSTDQNPPASSSSSLRSLSYDSPEYPPFLIDIPSTRYISENPQEAIVEQALRPSPSVFSTTSPHQQAIQALSQIRSPQIPSIESEEAAMAKAILAVICSSPSSASSSFQPQPQQNLPPNYPLSGQASAFKWYRSLALAPTVPMSARFRRQNMLKRSIAFLRSLNTMRSQEQLQASRTSSTQLHHMISERRRREKLNESFQALRSLLPPGTKKDKASVLMSTTEYLSSLKAQVAELSRRNQILEAQLLPQKTVAAEEASSSSNERLEVRITQLSESTSAARLIDLQVRRRGEVSIIDLVVSLLEFLKRDQNVSLMSIEANTTMEESTSVNRIVLRLKIEGEWDESAFQEAVRRVVNDQA